MGRRNSATSLRPIPIIIIIIFSLISIYPVISHPWLRAQVDSHQYKITLWYALDKTV